MRESKEEQRAAMALLLANLAALNEEFEESARRRWTGEYQEDEVSFGYTANVKLPVDLRGMVKETAKQIESRRAEYDSLDWIDRPSLSLWMRPVSACNWGYEPDEDLRVVYVDDMPEPEPEDALQIRIGVTELRDLVNWEAMLAAHQYCCLYCGNFSFEMHMDHIEAKRHGGLDARENIAPACPACNVSKHAKPLRAWVKSKKLSRSAIRARWRDARRSGVLPL